MYGGYQNLEDYESELYNDNVDKDNSEEEDIDLAEQLLYSKVHYNVNDDSDQNAKLLPNGIDIDSYIAKIKHESECSSEEEWTLINDHNAEYLTNSNENMETNILGVGSDDHNWFINRDDINASIENNKAMVRKKIPLRYSTVRCRNCNKAGHLSIMCPSVNKIVSCYLCGTKGHKGNRCSNQLCFNCGLPGHQKLKCTKRRRLSHDKCHRCIGFGHIKQECSEIWRQYHITTSLGSIIKPKPGTRKTNVKVYCYNCGKRGHFGSECRREKMTNFLTILSPFIRHYDGSGENTCYTKENPINENTEKKKKIHYLKSKINGRVNDETSFKKKSKSSSFDITHGHVSYRKCAGQKDSNLKTFKTQKLKRLKKKMIKKSHKLGNEKWMNSTDRGFKMSKNN